MSTCNSVTIYPEAINDGQYDLSWLIYGIVVAGVVGIYIYDTNKPQIDKSISNVFNNKSIYIKLTKQKGKK